ADGFEEFEGGFGVEFQEFGFDFGVEENGVGGGDGCFQFGDLVGVGEDGFVGVEDIEERFGGQQRQLFEQVGVDFTGSGEQGAAGFASCLGLFGGFGDLFAVLFGIGFLVEANVCLVEGLQVGEEQFGFDDLDIGGGVDPAVDVHHG